MKKGQELFNGFFTRYRHALLLLFWPIFGGAFVVFERMLPLTYNTVWCPADDLIPFNELFIIPYYGWYLFIISMIIVLFFKDTDEFKRYMWFIIIGYSIAMVIYIIYPTQQTLRPESFERSNLLTDMVADLYVADTNTNVCPSIHVIGQMAAFFAAWRNPQGRSAAWRSFWVISTVAVCMSTVSLKQHSLIDVAAGLIVAAAVYFLIYGGERVFVRAGSGE